MALDPTGSIPGVKDSELLGAVGNLASVPATSLDDRDRFEVAVREIVETRARDDWKNEDESDIGVFVLAPYPRKTGDRFEARPVSHLVATGRPILGKLFFLNRDASYGRVMDLPTDADGMVDWLVDSGLGKYPVIFVYRATKLLLARANGAKHDLTHKEIIRDKPPLATPEAIGEALNLIHSDSLIAPTVCPPGVWEKGRAGQYVPGVQPEKVIQRELASGLRSWFRGVVRAELEDTISVGRIDVRLLQKQADGKWVYWAIVELKVLRSSHNAKKGKLASPVSLSDNTAAIAEGVRQVFAFAKNRGADIALLEIFDLRKDKTKDVLKEGVVVAELAKCSPEPNCRIWPLFGSASDARSAGFC